jgi:hypothetical protein
MVNAMKVFSGVIDRIRSGLSAQPAAQPFVATMSVIDFSPDSIMQPVVADYRDTQQLWAQKNLPIVVGQIRPDMMQRLTGGVTDPEVELFCRVNVKGLDHCERLVRKSADQQINNPMVKQEIKSSGLLSAWAQIAHEICQQDRQWFGPASTIKTHVHREIITAPHEAGEGQGRFTYAGQWHRDMLQEKHAAIGKARGYFSVICYADNQPHADAC